MKADYFASFERKASDVIDHIESEFDLSAGGVTAFKHLAGLHQIWERNYAAYYNDAIGSTSSDGSLEFVGEQGELVKMRVNEARSLIRDFMSIVSKQRLNFEALSESFDYGTLSGSSLANAICDQFVHEKKLDFLAEEMLEQSLVLGAGFIELEWDETRGRLVDGAGGKRPTGDIVCRVRSVYDVMYDLSVPDFYELDHVTVLTPMNRWDLIATFPQMAKDIENLPSARSRFFVRQTGKDDRLEDTVMVRKFYHRSTPALPEGRLLVYGDHKTVFFNKTNPYGPEGQRFIPIVQCRPERVMGTGIGWPMLSEILPAQEMLNSTFSTIASNQAAFGVHPILAPNTSDLDIKDIAGLSFIRYNPTAGEPKALNLTATPPEIFKFADMLRSYMMELARINSALRGAPPPGVTSGTAIATLTANAMEFSASANKAVVIALETLMNMVVQIEHDFADIPQLVYVVGPNKQTRAKEWVGTDLASVRRIRMKQSNPMSRTAGGRMSMAEQMLANGLIKDAEGYFSVVEHGNLEVVSHQSVDEKLLIEKENELLREGKTTPVMSIDKHARHINSHKTLFFDPAIRMLPDDDPVKMAIAEHIARHVEIGGQVARDNPVLMAIIETGQMPTPEALAAYTNQAQAGLNASQVQLPPTAAQASASPAEPIAITSPLAGE